MKVKHYTIIIMDIKQFKWDKYPLECEEYYVLLDIISPNNILNHWLSIYPTSKIVSNDKKFGEEKTIMELSNIENKFLGLPSTKAVNEQITIILNLDIIEFDSINVYYITKMFNNKNFILGITNSSNYINKLDVKIKNNYRNDFPENIYTRFEHVYIENCDNLIEKCNRYLARKNIELSTRNLSNNVFMDTIDARIWIY